MGKKNGTSVWIPQDLLERLQRLKRHPRETYGDVIRRLLDERGRGT